MQVNVYTVSQINGYIKRLFENDVFLADLYIEGEISNFKQHTSGHLYFSLKDETGSVDCVMFRTSARTLAFEPKNGESVLVRGRVSLYEKTGKYQLYINYMQPAGKGRLYMEFERLKKKLDAEGIFDPKAKKPIPAFPKTVALVTSPTGAAVRDMINVASRRDPSVKLVVVPVLVQGENAAADIARGIEKVNRWGGADVMIIGRGGGSMEDLWAFNEEIVARAVYASRIPVISAVGHEVDFTISDFAADLRAPTPSAAAELAVPDTRPLSRRCASAFGRIKRSAYMCLADAGRRLEHSVKIRGMKRPLDRIFEYQMAVEDCITDAGKSLSLKLDLSAKRLEKSMASIENLSPINLVKRGYSLVYAKKGELVKSVKQIQEKDEINIELGDGRIIAEVKAVED